MKQTHPRNGQTTDLLKIGDFARVAGTNLRTLRYYEEIGLLSPALRSEGGFRYYRTTDANRVALIRNLQDLGLQLEQIGELLKTRDEGLSRPEWIQRVERALDAQKARIEARIAELEAQRQQVAAARNKLVDCSACEHRPTAENNFCEPCQQTGTAIPGYLSALF